MSESSAGLPDALGAELHNVDVEECIAEVNQEMPWTCGSDELAEIRIDAVVPSSRPLPEVARAAGGSYRVPAKLRPETDYAWTVTSAGSEIGSGRFRTLSSEALKSVARRKPSDKSDFSDRLLFTLLLQEMGATQEAQESWARLAAERADLPELAAFAK